MNKSVLTILISSLFLLASCGNDNPASADNESSSSEVTRSSSSSTEQVNSSSAINNENISSSQIDEKYSSSSSDVSAESSSGGTVSTFPTNYDSETGLLTDDRNNKVYKTAKIGNQIWMAENINLDISTRECSFDPYESYIGTTICPKKSTEADCETYGRLYSVKGYLLLNDNEDAYYRIPAVTEDSKPYQGICPKGWHVPSIDEWNILLEESSLNDLLSIDAGGTNATGFDVKMIGYATEESSEVYENSSIYSDEVTRFATVDEASASEIVSILFKTTRAASAKAPKTNHFAVRCLMN